MDDLQSYISEVNNVSGVDNSLYNQQNLNLNQEEGHKKLYTDPMEIVGTEFLRNSGEKLVKSAVGTAKKTAQKVGGQALEKLGQKTGSQTIQNAGRNLESGGLDKMTKNIVKDATDEASRTANDLVQKGVNKGSSIVNDAVSQAKGKLSDLEGGETIKNLVSKSKALQGLDQNTGKLLGDDDIAQNFVSKGGKLAKAKADLVKGKTKSKTPQLDDDDDDEDEPATPEDMYQSMMKRLNAPLNTEPASEENLGTKPNLDKPAVDDNEDDKFNEDGTPKDDEDINDLFDRNSKLTKEANQIKNSINKNVKSSTDENFKTKPKTKSQFDKETEEGEGEGEAEDENPFSFDSFLKAKTPQQITQDITSKKGYVPPSEQTEGQDPTTLSDDKGYQRGSQKIPAKKDKKEEDDDDDSDWERDDDEMLPEQPKVNINNPFEDEDDLLGSDRGKTDTFETQEPSDLDTSEVKNPLFDDDIPEPEPDLEPASVISKPAPILDQPPPIQKTAPQTDTEDTYNKTVNTDKQDTQKLQQQADGDEGGDDDDDKPDETDEPTKPPINPEDTDALDVGEGVLDSDPLTAGLGLLVGVGSILAPLFMSSDADKVNPINPSAQFGTN
tara:strand:+ start:135 stop:1967 length:1833 start_codon:yes stop_codon:yes gene_type:complete